MRIIRDFLAATSKPADLNDMTWDAFVDFMRNAPDSDALRFIKDVEWLTEQVDANNITEQLLNNIGR